MIERWDPTGDAVTIWHNVGSGRKRERAGGRSRIQKRNVEEKVDGTQETRKRKVETA
jgi:hypothetical protein